MEHLAWSLAPTRHNGGCRSGVGLVDSRIGLSLTWHALLARHLRTKQTYYSIFHTVDLALESTTESLQGRRFLTQAMLRIAIISLIAVFCTFTGRVSGGFSAHKSSSLCVFYLLDFMREGRGTNKKADGRARELIAVQGTCNVETS